MSMEAAHVGGLWGNVLHVHLEISNSDGRCGELNGATVFIGQS